MNDYYQSLPDLEKARINSIEVFDEYEEFELKCSHYRMLCATSCKMVNISDYIVPTSRPASPNLEFVNSETSLHPVVLSADSVPMYR